MVVASLERALVSEVCVHRLVDEVWGLLGADRGVHRRQGVLD